MSTQHALTKFVGPIKVAGVEGSRCLGHHRAPVRIHGSGGRSRRHGCLEQPPFTGCLHDPQGSVSGGGDMNGPTELNAGHHPLSQADISSISSKMTRIHLEVGVASDTLSHCSDREGS